MVCVRKNGEGKNAVKPNLVLLCFDSKNSKVSARFLEDVQLVVVGMNEIGFFGFFLG